MRPVVVYTRAYCGYCSRAMDLLRRKGAAVTEIDATGDPVNPANVAKFKDVARFLQEDLARMEAMSASPETPVPPAPSK